jgi:adenylate cyclase
MRGMMYAYAVAKRAEDRGWKPERRVPLPGLENPMSQLAVPLIVRDELIGVICVESETPYRFHEEDKATIELLGSHLAIAIQNMQLRESEEAMQVRAEPPAPPPPAARSERRRELTYYRDDEVLMLDGDYLIRSLPARILWKLLKTKQAEARCEFTNRELRLDKSLNLPDFKDNLETRLLLLRRRLEQKGQDIRIVPKGRGRFAVELGCQLDLVEKA